MTETFWNVAPWIAALVGSAFNTYLTLRIKKELAEFKSAFMEKIENKFVTRAEWDMFREMLMRRERLREDADTR